jgi:hypothetical protein
MTSQVFVVGTGRSGTATLAAMLSTPPGCRVAHEHEPRLLAEVSDFLAGRLSHAQMVELLRRTRGPAAIGGTRLSGEANQRLSFILPALAEAFPAARLLWVLRDGRATVASMHHRKWYHPREASERPPAVAGFATHRVQGDEVGDVSPAAWRRLDAFGRCCWYWAYTNRLIEREAARLGLPLLRLRLEDIDDHLDELAAFLDLGGALPRQAPRSNEATGGRPLSWRAWSPRQRATFAILAGAEMDRHYPGWRTDMRWTIGQEVRGLLTRVARASSVLVASHTRPLRARLGLIRGRPGPSRLRAYLL